MVMRSTFRDQRKASGGVRLGVAALAASTAVPALWALVSPRSFFSDFPGLGAGWVRAFPPYNEHLIRDIGSFYLAFTSLLGAAAFRGDRKLIKGSLLAFLIFSLPHVVWHWQHVVGSGAVERWGSVVSLGAGVVLSVSLLVAVRRR